MNKKILALILASMSMQGCIEIDELNEQNELLKQQNAILEAQSEVDEEEQEPLNFDPTRPITVHGVVIDSLSEMPVLGGTVKIKIGNDWSEPHTLNSGTFEIKGLPVNSNYQLLVESDDGEFMDRVFFNGTGWTDYGVESVRDLGGLRVGAPLTKEIKVSNTETEQHLSGLVFKANSAYGDHYSASQYFHTSVEDVDTATYTITVPAGLTTHVIASLDLDGDDQTDYVMNESEDNFHRSGTELFYHVDTATNVEIDNEVELSPYGMTDDFEERTIQVRFNVVDSKFNFYNDLNVELEDGTIVQYDEEQKQYVADLNFKNVYSALNVFVPSFLVGDVEFQSSTISVGIYSDKVSVNFYNTNNDKRSIYYDYETSVIDVVIHPVSSMLEYNVDVLEKQEVLVQGDFSYKVFYAQPIELKANSVRLTQHNALAFVKGNESDSDFVEAGTTRFTYGDQIIEASANLSLNNTLLTAAPTTELELGYEYTYEIGTLINAHSDREFDSSQDNKSFNARYAASSFDVNEIAIDNNNHFVAGDVIVSENTAGEASTGSNYETRPYFVFPSSILALKSFSINIVSYIKDGVEVYTDVESTIVSNGYSYASTAFAVSLADNEALAGESSNVLTGLAVENGKYIVQRPWLTSFADDTPVSENSITFTYVSTTFSGEVEEGTITLPIK